MGSIFNIESDDPAPDYRQLYRQVREAILRGDLPAGSRLPSSRELAAQLHTARITVVQAYRQLEREGFVMTRPGSGTFVATALTRADVEPAGAGRGLTEWGVRAARLGAGRERPADEDRVPETRPAEIDFSFGRSFAELFPYDVWRRLLARYLSTDDAMMARYGTAAGYLPLRETIATYLRASRGVTCDPRQVVIVSGAQQALDILARLLLVPGDEVLVETPGYRDAFSLFRLHDARLTGLPVDEQGLPVDRIPPGCRARLVFVTPAHQFPKGGTMPLERRVALLKWAATRGALVIEDDYDGDLRYEGQALTALQGLDSERVVYLGTFSKVLFPALRLGYLVLPPRLLEPFIAAKDLVDRGAPTLTQAAVADFIEEGHFERHLRQLRRVYGRRRTALVEALERHMPGLLAYSPVAAGLHVMTALPPGSEEGRVVRAAAERGVRVYPGAPFYLEQPSPPAILLGFSGLDEDNIDEGVRRLAEVIP